MTQQDLLMPTLTVYETLLFFVTLKMGGEVGVGVGVGVVGVSVFG